MHTVSFVHQFIPAVYLLSHLSIVKLIPHHRYGTRANVRRKMSEQEVHNVEIRMEIDDLKSSMTNLAEMLQVLIARGEPPQRTVIQEVASAAVDPQHVQMPPSTWPEFGLPHNFSPPHITTSLIGQTSRSGHQAPVFSESRPVVHTTRPPYENPIFEYNAANAQSVDNENVEPEEINEQYQTLEKRLRVVEGKDFFSVDANNMCLVSNLIMPPKFKTPEFVKYKGNSCPKAHLVMYFRKMAAYTNNQKLLIHCFQDSLTGASLQWYMNLEQNNIHCFQDLSNAFMQQYKYNLDMTPDRRQLQNMTQKERESFKEYAQRWRELASQVEPPLAEKELTRIFMDTLSPFFWEKMIGSVSSNFTDLVTIGQRLEEGIKSGKVSRVAESSNAAKKPYGNSQKKREDPTNAVLAEDRRPHHRPQHSNRAYIAAVTPVVTAQPAQTPQRPAMRQNHYRNRNQFDHIPVTYTELYPALVQKGLITTKALLPPNPLPSGFRSDLHCAFHEGAAGHDLENCYALKARVQDLIKAEIITFKDSNPNVQSNPLPEHEK